MKAAREAFLLIFLLGLIIWPLTPQGCYTLFNAKDGYGDKEAVARYLKERAIPFKEDELSRRNLGVTHNCEASFVTDVAVLQKLTAAKDSKLIPQVLSAQEKKALGRASDHKQSLINILKIPPLLTEMERADFAKAYDLDNLLIYAEGHETLPSGWTEARLFVTKIDGKAHLFYAR